jgi:hypothetical protein
MHTSGASRRENAKVCLTVIASQRGRREAPPDDKLREAIHISAQRKNGLLRRFAPRNDDRAAVSLAKEVVK